MDVSKWLLFFSVFPNPSIQYILPELIETYNKSSKFLENID